MATDSCLFALRLGDPTLSGVIHERVHALCRFYAEDRPITPSVRQLAAGHVIVGAIPLLRSRRPRFDPSETWSWGETAPRWLAASNQLLSAPAAHLRGFDGAATLLAADSRQARVINGANGPATLYRAADDGIRVWSTHAVAAAWLANGEAELELTRLPELLAFDFVGASGTLVRGATAVAPASSVAMDRWGTAETSYWPSAERWEALDPADAQQRGEEALIRSLDSRLASGTAARLALTAGLDSTVVAVALQEAGKPFEAFTWGESGWPDTEGAEAFARKLGVGHTAYAPAWLSEEAAMRELQRQVCWADGVAALSLATRVWPPDGSAFLTGAGGETGRAFYYARQDVERHPRPTRDELIDALRVERRIHHASLEAVDEARRSALEWVESAFASGRNDWSALDVVYAEQRVAHWGRSQYPCLAKALVPALTPAEVARALSSQPIGDRLSSAFHRRFLGSRGLAPKRTATRSIFGRVLAPAVRAHHSFHARGTRPTDQSDPLLVALWMERPDLRSWVADEVLKWPDLQAVMGEPWADVTRSEFLAGRRRATEQAQLAAGPFVLRGRLSRLGRSAKGGQDVVAI